MVLRSRLMPVVIATVLLVGAADADAQTRVRQERAVTAALPAVTAPARGIPSGIPLVVTVALKTQSLTVYAGTEPVLTTPISSGMAGHRTPTGVFAILQRARYHESNLYSNAPMPFMQRLTWSGVALHAGKLPGYPASHGCIRLPYETAARLFSLLRMGGRVVVSDLPLEPQAIVHAALPQPRTTLLASADIRRTPNLLLPAAHIDGAAEGAAVSMALLAPRAAAAHEKVRAAAALAEARQTLQQRLADAAEAANRADAARRARFAAEADVARYQAMAARAARLVASQTDAEERGQAEASLFAAEEAVNDARAEVVRLRADELALLDASFPPARRAREVEEVVERAIDAVRLADVGTEPISVLVSRKDNRVYVRQGFQPVMEGSFTLADPAQPLGTHVFSASTAAGDEARLAWTVTSVPDGGGRQADAAAALARVTLEPGLAEAIGRRLWAGASLIISDQGLGPETGRGTDFVVLTR